MTIRTITVQFIGGPHDGHTIDIDPQRLRSDLAARPTGSIRLGCKDTGSVHTYRAQHRRQGPAYVHESLIQR